MRQPSHAVLVLLGGLLALIPLQLLDPPSSPALLDALDLARLLIGTLPALLLPGFALAPLLLRRDLLVRDTVSLPHLALAALGLNIVVQVVHLNALRLLSLPIGWPLLLGLTAVETVVGLALLRHRRPHLTFAPSSAGLRAGFAVVLSLLAAGGVVWRTELQRDSSWSFYGAELEEGFGQPVDPGALRFVRAAQDSRGMTVAWEAGEPFVAPQRSIPLTVRNQSDDAQSVPVFFLVHGPIGTSAHLLAGRETLASEAVTQFSSFEGVGKEVERSWRWGSVALVGHIEVPPRGEALVTLDLEPEEGYALADVAVVEWSGLSSNELLEFLRGRGFRFMHPFQLLNVTENVRWADEVATDYVLSGRSPDGLSTLHQPPGWTYQYAPARLLLTGHLATASALFFVILAGLGLVGLLAAEEVSVTPMSAPVGALLGLGVGATALQHARCMISDGSMNFPDNLYALALAASVLLLVAGRMQTFLLWAGLATLLRYPGVVVVALAAGSLGLLRVDLRRKVVHAVMRFGLAVALFSGVMLLIAVLTHRLDAWLFALWFETIPEHFDNNEDALDFWQRPLEFTRLWALLGGGALLAALPPRTTMGRVATATALLYAPFLAFIDHFSHHYFLPLLALCAMAAAAEAAGAESARGRMGRGAAFATLAVGLALWAARQHL